jgi:predicted nucleic acid-binding protein
MINGTIVDTSVWIDYFNGVDNSQTKSTSAIAEGNLLFLLPIILQEILQGIKNEKDFLLIKTAFLEYPFLKYNEIETAIEAASLYRFLKLKGITVRKPNDCMIAALCIKNKLSLLHKDKDFDNIAKYTSLKIYK